MPPPQRVVDWVKQRYQKPTIDLEWLDGCCQWLANDRQINPTTEFDHFVSQVENQLLESDLSDSMQPGTGFHASVGRLSGNLPGPPILVQIVAITEIGHSAFQLEQIRAAREERLLAGVGNEEGEEDGDIEVEGEGPMPKFPRSMLRFQLSDGVVILEAMEYRQIPEFSLGNTPLGYKLRLKGTRIQNGMAFLEPKTIELLGGKQAELEEKQLDDFRRGLQLRLHPDHQEPTGLARAPLQIIEPPPVAPSVTRHNDDIDMDRPRRLPASRNPVPSSSTSTVTGTNPRPIAPLPKSSGVPATRRQEVTTSVASAQLAPSGTAAVAQTASSPYFSGATSSSNTLAPITQAGATSLSNAPSGSNPRIADDASSDYGMDDDFPDSNFFDDLDRAEREALGGGQQSNADSRRSTSVASLYANENNPSTSGSSVVPQDVIQIDDSDDDEKENQPVLTRHVRRRTMDSDDDEIEILDENAASEVARLTQSRAPARSQRSQPSRPAVFSTQPEDVIDISDSD